MQAQRAIRTRPFLACISNRTNHYYTRTRLPISLANPQRQQRWVTKAVSEGSEFVEDTGFSLAKISFGSILAPVGVTLLVYGFASYIEILPGSSASSLLLIYGFIGALLGFALKYAELKPVECKTTQQAFDLRSTQMTDIQKQVREDCTRFRYGDEKHLEEALERIFRFNKPGGVPRRLSPTLTALREEVVDGNYALVMIFESELKDTDWTDRVSKFASFFGPGITAQFQSTGENEVEISLICDGSGKGRSGKEEGEVLPPLMPGLPARQKQ
eukprot:TRINITY_DN8625_c0_g1_i2.p2 TRINITY_DN8625_c0_g1~~TRINITY_DN8625_c0_g1_i2.p2  ORF type:complete len:282 (+),score=20.04 TRINITY_DN8625_c0_g1_i2:33-848(+)